MRVLALWHPTLRPIKGIGSRIEITAPLGLEHLVQVHSPNMPFKLCLLLLMLLPLTKRAHCRFDLSELIENLPISLIDSQNLIFAIAYI